MRKVTRTIKQTHKLAEELVNEIYPKPEFASQAVIAALIGDLGTGKTVFTQGFAKALGVKEQITSPTFVILKRFKIKDSRFRNFIHVDAYRIEDPKEILDLGWNELINNPKNIILVEWAERIKKILARPHFEVKLYHQGEKKRAIDIHLIK